ncbi:hypothetical protein [Nonomuraea sp. NPDC048826]|uniref:hypothetical protein n=1 Tax=Nonomuraea sp. NPDC048826 TaxID=3364347 RepID=UPI00371C5E62
MTASEMVLAGLSAVVVVAVVVWRGPAVVRLRAEVRGQRAALRGRSGTAHHFFVREREGWSPEVDGVMAARLEELERREAEVGALARPGEAASRLGDDYQVFGELVRAVSAGEAAASMPRADLAELLAAPGQNDLVAGLRDRRDGLEERRARLVQRIREASPDGWAKLVRSATALAADHRRLGADVTRAWERMFPDRAAARAAEEKAVFQHILNDIGRRGRAASRRRDRSGGSVSDPGHYDDLA